MNCFHYKILSVFIISLSLFTFPTNAKEYSSEIGTLWNFTVSKQINRINLQIQQNVWTLGKYYERYMPIAVVSYTAVPKYLKLNALYYYMNQQTAPNIYKNRHRYQLGATFSYPVHRFSHIAEFPIWVHLYHRDGQTIEQMAKTKYFSVTPYPTADGLRLSIPIYFFFWMVNSQENWIEYGMMQG